MIDPADFGSTTVHRTPPPLVTGCFLVWIIGLVLVSVPTGAQEIAGTDSGSAAHAIPRTDEKISVDGRLDEPAWSTAWSYELGYEVRPGENIPAIVQTVVLVTFSESHLYVGFRAYDPDPAAIRAHLSDRDQAWTDDWVGVVLDTFNDERRNYLLVVNPFGSKSVKKYAAALDKFFIGVKFLA